MELDKKKELRADLMLLVVAMCWGFSYLGMKVAIKEVPTFALNTYRFLGAFAVAVALSFNRVKKVNKITLLYSCFIGIALSVVYTGATIGVQYTTLSNCAFLCATTVFFTPLIEFIVYRKSPEKKLIVAVAVCFVGIMLMTLKNDFSFNLAHLKGDLFSLSTGISYAIQIVITSKAVSDKRVDPYVTGVFSLGFCGVVMLILSLSMETFAVPKSAEVLVWLAFLAIFCTGVAFVVQPIAQQYTEPTHVGIIFSLEPVFAGIVGFMFAGEVLTMKEFIGEIIVIISLFYMEIDVNELKKNRMKKR